MQHDDAKPFDRELLARRRNRFASVAGAHDFLLRRVADDIGERLQIVQRDFPKALNLGAHNGAVSELIRRLPNVGLVIDADACDAMLSACAGPRVRCDEEALPFTDGVFDLVVSGLSLQFVNDLPGTFVQVRKALKADGLFLAAMLGGETLKELRQSWLSAEADMLGGASPRVAPFADVRALGSLAQRAGFALPVADSETITVTYGSPLALMQDLRAMGASNMLTGRRRVPVTRGLVQRACEIYADLFALYDGRVPATFEILSLTAWVPHESQPKPLVPGSGKISLAKVLGSKTED
ncbi:MAG: methyltransferase domain-containing protein [Alphaproteobacteria bacterium]|nr:methyltransferase domain-containing protein [Alphaproteobacteria bacterium]